MKISKVFVMEKVVVRQPPSELKEEFARNEESLEQPASVEAALLPKVVRGCEFLQYLFPKRIREEIFLPSYQDMYTLNLIGREKLGGQFASKWMDFVLILRTLDIVARCVLTWARDYLRFPNGK